MDSILFPGRQPIQYTREQGSAPWKIVEHHMLVQRMRTIATRTKSV
jgi:hypothetical protein